MNVSDERLAELVQLLTPHQGYDPPDGVLCHTFDALRELRDRRASDAWQPEAAPKQDFVKFRRGDCVKADRFGVVQGSSDAQGKVLVLWRHGDYPVIVDGALLSLRQCDGDDQCPSP